MTGPRILVVDDDDSIRSYLREFLTSLEYEVECISSGEQAITRLQDPSRPSVLILDLVMPRVGGLEVMEEMARLHCTVPTIVLSGLGQIKTVVKAIRLGATDYLVKPFEDSDLEVAIQNALEGDGGNAGASMDGGEMLSRSDRMLRIRKVASQVADTDVPVLILGESGVGKEVLARHIHASSGRRDAPFVKVNCAALPTDLLESELFGYERGAFTGALRDKPGKFELAGKGTILLDEIGEMIPALQAKLLHVLQDGEFERLGSSRLLRAQARVLAATNRSLESLVSKGAFREDLYYRLNVIRLEIPPLRERREDIGPLSKRFLEVYQTKYKRPARTLPPALVTALERYSWPGNIRQLENVIKRFVILPEVDLILGELTESSEAEATVAPPPPKALPARENTSLKEASAMAAERVERELVIRTLEAVKWNRKEAASKLSISYKALLNKLKKWDVGGRSKDVEGD